MAARRLLLLARRRAGLTQRELAERSGVPQSTIARIESGRSDPRTKTLERLLTACNQTLEAYDGSGAGIDTSLVHEMLRRTPGERIEYAAQTAAAMTRLRPRRVT